MTGLIIRGVLYALLATALAQLAFFEAVTLPQDRRFAELGYVELSQACLLGLCAVLLGIAAWRVPDSRPLSVVMALGFAILLVRENDQILEIWLPHGVWKWPATVLFAGILWVTLRQWPRLVEQARRLATTPAIGVLFAGYCTMVFSRFFGRSIFWESVMEERYWRVVKNAAEESVELFAIGLMTAGVIEMLVGLRNSKR